MYLVGNLSDRDWFSFNVEIKAQPDKEDLGKAKMDQAFQVINMEDQTYYDPKTNSWNKFEFERVV